MTLPQARVITMGRVKVSMTPRNDLGVLDHDVTLPNGATVHNALRVTPALHGSALTFRLVRQAQRRVGSAFNGIRR